MFLKTIAGTGLFLLVSGLYAQDSPLIQNGDFEEGFYDWESPTWSARSVPAVILDGKPPETIGRRSLKLKTGKGENSIVITRFPSLMESRNYRLSFMLRKIGSGDGYIEVRCNLTGKGLKSITRSTRIKSSDMKEIWTLQEMTVDVPVGYTGGSLWVLYSGEPEILLDNVSLIPLKADVNTEPEGKK